MIKIGGIEITAIEAKVMKEAIESERKKYTDEEIIEQLGSMLFSDEDPRDWAREIIRDIDEKVKL